MTTNLRENTFIITITSLTTVAFIALIGTLVLALRSSEDANVPPMMIIDLILVLVIFFVYFCKTTGTKQTQETTKVTEDVPALTPLSYHDIRHERKSKEDELNEKKLAAVSEYVQVVMSPYLKESEVTQLIANITMWVDSDEAVLTSIATDGRLTTLDLRHFAWNIGERFKWKGAKRASFLKIVFPVEMRELEVETIRRNLRQNGTCLIELDIPDKGCYEFINL